ncbi:hypothetical protein EDC94DRAFT_693312 [Helicostylum pulchrum]|nr:hypothetical protein EDC94DRAFT_693312 [Helicostylum pulchrum]
MTKYFKLLYSFRGTRQTYCTAKFNEAADIEKSFDYSFRYDSLDGLFVTYTLELNDLYGSNTADMEVSDKTSSVIGPEIIHVLEFNLSIMHSSLSFRHKEGLIFSDQANCGINFLQMENIRPATNLVDLVTTCLRNIEVVSLKAKDWSSEYNDPVIDLTGFKN